MFVLTLVIASALAVVIYPPAAAPLFILAALIGVASD